MGRRKECDLRRDNRLSLCFEQQTDYVTLEGRAELIDDRERSLRDIQALARRYGDDPASFDGQQRRHGPDARRARHPPHLTA